MMKFFMMTVLVVLAMTGCIGEIKPTISAEFNKNDNISVFVNGENVLALRIARALKEKNVNIVDNKDDAKQILTVMAVSTGTGISLTNIGRMFSFDIVLTEKETSKVLMEHSATGIEEEIIFDIVEVFVN